MNTTRLLLFANVLSMLLVGGVAVHKKGHAVPQASPVQQTSPVPPQPTPPVRPITTRISTPVPNYLNYDQTVAQLKKWNEEAPELTVFGTYGKTTAGKDIGYLRVVNRRTFWSAEKPRVLLTACIHGNEPLSSSTSMAWVGTLLDRYGKDQEVTDLLDSRDIYFVPVVCPDSYPNSRQCDGVDPNRDFPTQRDPEKRSVRPISALREFFLKVRPNAVISGHTSGRVFLQPWGDRTDNCPDHYEYQRVCRQMANMCGYRLIRACEMYGTPIHGSELDWYYRHGAFAVVMEMGNHQQIPSPSDIRSEFEKTFGAVKLFVREAPAVQLKLNRWVIPLSESLYREVVPLSRVAH